MTNAERSQFDLEAEANFARYPYPLKRALVQFADASIDTTIEERDRVILQVETLAKSDRLPAEVSRHLERSARVMRAVRHQANAQKVQRHLREHGRASGDPSDPRFDQGGDPK